MRKIFKLFAVVALALSSVGCIASGGYGVVPYGGIQIQPRGNDGYYGNGGYREHGDRRLYNTRPGYVAPYQGWNQPYYHPPAVIVQPPVYNFGGRGWGKHHRHHRD